MHTAGLLQIPMRAEDSESGILAVYSGADSKGRRLLFRVVSCWVMDSNRNWMPTNWLGHAEPSYSLAPPNQSRIADEVDDYVILGPE